MISSAAESLCGTGTKREAEWVSVIGRKSQIFFQRAAGVGGESRIFMRGRGSDKNYFLFVKRSPCWLVLVVVVCFCFCTEATNFKVQKDEFPQVFNPTCPVALLVYGLLGI